MPHHPAALPCRLARRDHVEERCVSRHTVEVLTIMRDFGALAARHRSSIRRSLTDDCTDQRRFAGTVRSDQTDDVSPANPLGEAVEQHATLDREPELSKGDDLVSTTVSRLEEQRHRPVGAGRRTQPGQAVESLPAPHRLSRVLAGKISLDIVTLASDRSLLLVEGPALRQPPLFAL